MFKMTKKEMRYALERSGKFYRRMYKTEKANVTS
jgi:hypothetical protein